MTFPSVENWAGRQNGWAYHARSIDGSGLPGPWLGFELPFLSVQMTDVLSGPPQMTATINPRFGQLLGSDKQPLLKPWRTEIYAEQDGIIRAAGILVASGFQGSEWNLDVSGFSGYAEGMPFEGDLSFVETDPLDLVRAIWAHIQDGQDSDLGLVLDTETTTPVRVGKPLPLDDDGNPVDTNTSADEGPYRLTWWSNDNLGSDIDDLAGSTPFDYHERHQWNADKTAVEHYLDFGYPTLGIRRSDLRFVLGENIQTIPTIEDDGTDYATHVRVMGAGEGSAIVLGEARRTVGTLRRAVTVDRKDIGDQGRANRAAGMELAHRLNMLSTPSVIVRNTPLAPLGAWTVGDEIRVQADEEWRSLDLWFRVVSLTVNPEDPEIITMDLLRSDT